MNRYENNRASVIINKITENLDIKITELAKDLNISHTNLWFYFHGQRKWNVESWLDTLTALGCVEVHKYGGLLLKIPVDQKLTEHIESLSGNIEKYVK